MISTNECSNEVPHLEENSIENQVAQEDEGRLDDEEEDESSIHINEEVEEFINNNYALGLTKGNEETSDELGTNDAESESLNDDGNAPDADDKIYPLANG